MFIGQKASWFKHLPLGESYFAEVVWCKEF